MEPRFHNERRTAQEGFCFDAPMPVLERDLLQTCSRDSDNDSSHSSSGSSLDSGMEVKKAAQKKVGCCAHYY